MKERIIITGYSGSLAKITTELLKDDYEIIGLTSNKEKVNNKDIYYWNTSTNEIDEKALENCKHIIHLSGYPILKRWTKKNKRLMHQSRIGAANLLFNKCKELISNLGTIKKKKKYNTTNALCNSCSKFI